MAYESLLAYIPYFEDRTKPFCAWQPPAGTGGNEIPVRYPVYDDMLDRFICDVGESGLMRTDYMEALKGVDINDAPAFIECADMPALRAIFTYFVRQERFCEGLWETAAKNGVFLCLLVRLGELTKVS